ncbi:MAG TPA: phosphotransferase [Pirellulales bacterium]|jgi:Ser/Thr protein kinase RdoA (MazF antagonist)|nr:phosphotransferase [Pirellulales bacterium]
MANTAEYAPVLARYPADCQPSHVESLEGAGGFSGARFWRLTTPRGLLCLRRWPPEYPTVERLEFIQAVLWHVNIEGFALSPLPLEADNHAGFVEHQGALWQLEPWLPGVADYHAAPGEARLRSALACLAQFHLAAASFPLADNGPLASPRLLARRDRLQTLRAGELDRLAAAIRPGRWPALAERAARLVQLVRLAADRVEPAVAAAVALRVPIQPCIGDIWHDHVLFLGNAVSGLVDFGGMRADSVAGDIARLLGSLVADDAAGWQIGLAAYDRHRPLSTDERRLVTAFDRSGVLLSGLEWIERIYVQRRVFDSREAIESRLDTAIARLARLIAP